MPQNRKSVKQIILALITAMVCIAVFAFVLFSHNGAAVDFLFRNSSSSEDFVKIIDVGQGDCALIKSNGYCALIDTGTVESGKDLVEALTQAQVERIDVLILSHLHNDHTGGIKDVFNTFNVDNLILPELSTHSEGIYYAEFAINEVTMAKGGVYSATAGMNFMLGEFEITILASYGAMADENDRSVVLMAEMQNKKFLFTGDIEAKSERRLLEQNINIDCDVLKVAHHGSKTSSTKDFLAVATPQFSAISLGKDNSFGHPHKKTLDKLKEIHSEILRTDICGDITFTVKNGEIHVDTEKGN